MLRRMDNRGAAFPLIIMVFVILTVLGVSLLQMSLGDARQAVWQNNKIQAHYLARSGVHKGIQMLETRLAASPAFNGTIIQLAAELQASVTNPYTIPDVGTFNITFTEGTYSSEIKITAVAETVGQIPGKATVIYNKELGNQYSFANPASEWMTGINLDKGINPSNPNKNYLGSAVMIEAKNTKNAVQSPKGSSNPSTFRASIIALKDYNGRSLTQVTNSIDLTFDAEIIYFLGDIKLNKNNTPMYLSVSNPVLLQKTYGYDANFPNPSGSPGRSPAILDYGPLTAPTPPAPNIYAVGMENIERYRAFISDPIATRTQVFNPGAYGVVKLGGGIRNDDNILVFSPTGKGYYYFRSGINLRNATTALGNGDLLHISDSDPIVPVLDSLLGVNMGISDPFWSNQ